MEPSKIFLTNTPQLTPRHQAGASPRLPLSGLYTDLLAIRAPHDDELVSGPPEQLALLVARVEGQLLARRAARTNGGV